MTAVTSPARAAAPAKGRLRAHLPWWFAAALLLVALFAPLLANNVPLLARAGGRWSFPALADLLGTALPGPGDLTWKQWQAQLPPGSGDFCLFPPWSHGPRETDLGLLRAPPTFAHPFGNDETGRDVLARIVRGSRSSLLMGLCGVALAALAGTALGAFAGLRRGAADVVVLRLVEVSLCFPSLLLLLGVAAFFGESVLGVIAVFALSMWPSFARIVRGELLSLRERDFVLAARGLGVTGSRLVFRHLLPQVKGQVGVTAAFCMASAVVAESTLSFLGIGPGVQSGSWGSILAQGKANAHLGIWHLWFFPAAAIVATVICCHSLADRLRPRR